MSERGNRRKTQSTISSFEGEEGAKSQGIQQPLVAETGTQFTVSKKTGTMILGHKELNSAKNLNEHEKHSP